MSTELDFAFELADLADDITLRRFRAEDLVVRTKPDLTPVTEADQAVERALRERIALARPGHRVVGEEFGADQGDGSARWIIDPIDGTKNYVRGVPVFATLLALERRGDLEVGVVSAPALRRRWWAVRGQGAFADGRRLRVSGVADLSDAFLCYGSLEGWDRHRLSEPFGELLRRSYRSRGFGDFWIHMLVAEGAADIAVEPEVSLWDLAALQLIVEEAGGRFTDLAGVAHPDGGSAVTTNGLLHDEVLAMLKG